MAHYVYVLDLLSYGSTKRTKIGISKNVEARVRRIGNRLGGGLAPEIHAVFAYPDEKAARAVESLVLKWFPNDPQYSRQRELLAAAADEVAAFVVAISHG